ncbi:MAG: alpha-amylase family glycosyl hydrolase [Pseudomonadota bacterium]
MLMKSENDLWWKGGVIYQIYPRSYQDSTGDGVGDLKGITKRLDYIASLGVDAIWISPFFQSPMLDFGYDVSDYRAIDPLFGTLEDFDTLLAEAHARNLKIMIDLVISHTSDQHDWFKESRASRDNPKSDWYVWADPNDDGTPPNNWLSIFGGSAWQWDTRRQQYYLHNFLSSQPDLNFHNEDVQYATLEVAKFWLDRGVDGFRLDTINFYFHDKELRDNPSLSLAERNASIAPTVNPYNHQDHIYSKSQPENLAYLEKLRALCDTYDARACLGEIGDAQRGLQLMGQYTMGEKRMHMCYAFEFLETTPATASWVSQTISKLNTAAPDAWPCWAFSNHDVVRHKTRWNLSGGAYRTYAVLMMCLKGTACLYQGEELGFEEADVPFEALQDPYGIEFWPEFKGRDGCRTPMVWDGKANDAGFGSGDPWLPISDQHRHNDVVGQEADQSSILAHYKAAIAFRRAHPELRHGDQSPLTSQDNVLSFYRGPLGAEVFCVFNLGDTPASFAKPFGNWESIDTSHIGGTPSTTTLPAWSFSLLKRKP